MKPETIPALHEVAVATGRLKNQAELASLVVERARTVAGGDAAVMRWFDAASGAFRLLATAGLADDPATELAADIPTAIRDAFKNARPVIMNDYESSGQTTSWGRSQRIQAQVAVPLLVEGKPLGTLAVLSFADHEYRASDAAFLSLLAAIVAPALEAARLAKEVGRQKDLTTQVYDALGVNVIVYDRLGRPVHYNRAAQRSWADALRDPSGVRDHTYPMYHEDGAPVHATERPFARAVAKKSEVRGVVAGYDVGSERRWTYVDAVPLLDASGDVDSVITSSIDITRLRKAEARQRAVIEAAPDPIVLFNAVGNIVDINPAAENTFQRRRDDVIGRSAIVLVGPRHWEAFQRWSRSIKETRSAEHAGRKFESTGRRSDGSEFPMEIVITDLPETSQLAAAFVRDLTLRDRLKESSERLASVIASAQVAVLASDLDGTITLSDGSGLAVLGLTAEDAIGRNLRTLMTWDSESSALIERMLGGSSTTGKLHVADPEIYLGAAASPMLNHEGAMTGISLVLTDVTARVHAKEAQRQSEAKSRLMAMMNHEVRTPLNSILGFAHLLADPDTGDLTEKQQRYMRNIEVSANHLLELINDSLNLARLDAGVAHLKLESFPVLSALEQAVDQVGPLAEAKGLTVEISSSASLSVKADRRQLDHVLLNLLSNAIRHTHRGGIITLQSRRSGDGVVISVADTGDGIAKEDQARLFQEFFQAGNHAPGGVGLGLAISRRLMTLMGGSIEVESELGRGSIFTVCLRAG